jgi:hypothetical protein
LRSPVDAAALDQHRRALFAELVRADPPVPEDVILIRMREADMPFMDEHDA